MEKYMSIETNNLVIYGSQRNTDTEDGGGQYNGKVITDGQSNNLFDDVSELDRTMGDVSMRKVFTAIDTNDTDKLMGAMVYIAQNPKDPNVSTCLFSTKDWTDQRNSAQNRVEQYLAKGAQATGTLLDTAYKGMKQIQTAIFTSETAYSVGTTLVLVQNENKDNQQEQYFRITQVDTHTSKIIVNDKEFEYQIVKYTFSDPLLYDFVGLSAKNWYLNSPSPTLLRETVVADTGKYYASVALTQDAKIGQRVLNAKSAFTQILPSAQTETPITDVNANSQDASLVASNSKSITVSKTITISENQSLYLGSAVLPGTFSLSYFGSTVTDNGGELFTEQGTSLGTIDYQNGLIKWASGANGSGTFSFTFTPAAAPIRPQDTMSIKVTAENRGMNWNPTLTPIPTAGSLQVSYVAQGKVYMLRDNGNGALKASNPAFGSGTVNYETGSVLLTCGALPDVNSSILFSWSQTLHLYDRANMPISKAYIPIEFDSGTIVNGSLTATWKVNGVEKKAKDNGSGNFTGDATGQIDYAKSKAKLEPLVLPNGGTEITITYDKGVKQSKQVKATVNSETLIEGTAAFKPNSIALTVQFDGMNDVLNGEASGYIRTINYVDKPVDSSKGQLVRIDTGEVQGIIKYAERTITLNPSYAYVYEERGYAIGVSSGLSSGSSKSQSTMRPAFTQSEGRTDTPLGGAFLCTINYRDTSDASTTLATKTATELNIDLTDGFTETILSGSLRMLLADTVYIDKLGKLYRDPDTSTGSSTYAGNLQYSGGLLTITSWNAGIENKTSLQGLITTMDKVTATNIAFRSAVLPLRPESVTIRATKAEGGTITIQPKSSGNVDTTECFGSFNWDYGSGEFFFREKLQITDKNREEVEKQSWYFQAAEYDENGKTYINKPIEVLADSIIYNAVGYSYIPLDAEILGLSATRLPSDGRVPIFRTGDVAVISASKSYQLDEASPGKTYQLDDQRISYCELEDSNGKKVDTSMYVVDYDYGRFTLNGDFALNNLKTPLFAKYRYQDLGLVNDVQIDGQITFTKPITHNYTADNSIIGSVLKIGDMFSRYSTKFVQYTWNDIWSDTATGSSVSANYNDAIYPITVSNKGAIQERWAIVFTGNMSFKIIGEYSGQIGTGTINEDCAPINPVTNAPYFVIKKEGWGSGWVTGNVLRFNTKAATYPVWCIRTVQQSEPTVLSDQFQLMFTGDIDREI